MAFVPKPTKQKVVSNYKTIYLPQNIADAVTDIAACNHTSFNNVVVSMIEYCLEEFRQEQQENSRE